MSAGDAAEKPAAKKPGFVKRVLGFPKRVSTAGCASCLTSLLLAVLVITVWVVFFLDPNNVPWRHSMSWTRIVLEVLLVIAIPLVLYQALRLWLEGDKSRFPDIDFAWRAGVEALQRSGLSLQSAPLFLVIGTSGPTQEKSLVRASGLALRVNEVPEGPAPVHWYANPEGIYLFCSETSWTSTLAALIEKRRAELASDAEIVVPAASPVTPSPQPAPQVETRPARPSDTGRGTIMLDQYVADLESQAKVEESDDAAAVSEASIEMITVPRPAGDESLAALSPHDSAEQTQRLHYVCQLLRQARSPLCPVNGILTAVPFEILQAGPRHAQELQKAVRSDLATVQRELRLRCPVTAIVVGMQHERGFREIVRRVGRQRATTQRFGRKFDVRIPATSERLGNLCIHVCGVFEDWIHTLFREAGALSRPGNTRLYALLCKIRVNVQNTLREFLTGAFAFEEQQKDLEEPLAFSGCYFAATGETEDQQAFVKGVFDKLTEEQEEIEWTGRATRTNHRYQALVAGSIILSCALVITVVSISVYRLLS